MSIYKYIFFLSFLFIASDLSAQKNVDSMLLSLKNSPKDTSYVKTKNEISKIYFSRSEYEKAIQNAQQALKIADSLKYEMGMAVSLNRLGGIYAEKGNFSKALAYFFQSLKIKESIGDLKGASFSYNNIGNIYVELGHNDYAVLYITKSLKLKEELNDSLGISNSLMNLGNVYKNMNKHEMALANYLKALKIREQLNVKSGMSTLLTNIGEVYSEDPKTESKSLEAYAKAYVLAEKAGEKNIMATLLNNTAVIYERQKLFDKAMDCLNRSLALSKEIGAKDLERNSYQGLADLYNKTGNYKPAFEYYKKYSTLKDEILNVESAKQFAEVTGKYETEKKDQEIALLKNEGLVSDLTIRRQKDMRNILFGGFIVLFIIAFLLLNRFQVKKKANKKLSAQNKLIEETNVELEKLSIVARETVNGVIIADADGEIEWANQGFTRLLGYDVEEFKQLKGSNLLQASSNPEISKIIAYGVNEKTSVSYESINVTRSGKELWVQSTLTPIIDDNGLLKKIVVIDSDITELKKAEKIILKKNRDITDSIEYAQRIQHAMLPGENEMKKYLKEFALFYAPKDIVSGDFYWLYGEENGAHRRIVIAVADCTGHGVPGALMSMIGADQLNRIVREEKQLSPGKILCELNNSIKKSMQQVDASSKDGMEMAICLIDTEKREICYAGANRPMYFFRKEENTKLKEIKFDRMAIGGDTPYNYEFEETKFNYNENDVLYIFSDGYTDQFGGEARKKFMTGHFKEMLLEIQTHDMLIQEQLIREKYISWKGTNQQIDDVTVLGLKLT